ncbi:TPA_asm: hypothetical protein vir519_00047 [Caudoviricetes sp. vir519]|nr:TPA_asm: hypothetical protein vir519_00047 [Caudoviricetes sp. vir519]
MKGDFRICKNGDYYDLIQVPSGHIPITMVKLWKILPLPVLGKRTDEFFSCPRCKRKSFYAGVCRICRDELNAEWNDDEQREFWGGFWVDYRKREQIRSKKKRKEYILLPFFVLAGKAGYIESNMTKEVVG